MKVKYEFLTQPPKGVWGAWTTKDGFKCYTDSRASAVRWYKEFLKKQP